MKTIWTIGHSTRTLEEFISMLSSFKIETLIDVRSYPGSKKFPHFNKENLSVHLEKNGIRYIHLKDLGGRRTPDPNSKNTVWKNASFRGYADYMETNEFKNAADKLTEIAADFRTAIMCSEAVWWRCHRSMISDYLKTDGWTVMHIMDELKAEEHPYTKPARQVQGNLFYGDK